MRSLVVLASLLVLSLFFSGCSQPSDVSAPTDTNEDVELNKSETQWCTSCETSSIGIIPESIVADFNEASCRLTISWETFGCPGTTEVYWGEYTRESCWTWEPALYMKRAVDPSNEHEVQLYVDGYRRVRWIIVSTSTPYGAQCYPYVISAAYCGATTSALCEPVYPYEEPIP